MSVRVGEMEKTKEKGDKGEGCIAFAWSSHAGDTRVDDEDRTVMTRIMSALTVRLRILTVRPAL